MKFYMIDAGIIKPKTHHKIFVFNFYILRMKFTSWIINLSEDELHKLNYTDFIEKYFPSIKVENNFELFEFLKTKHTFEAIGQFYYGDTKKINSFELDENDLMYIKLLS